MKTRGLDLGITLAKGSGFTTTHWSAVVAAGNNGSSDSQAALESLCASYWQPLHAYVRRWGYQPEDAQDLTQAFFARLLEKNYLSYADQQRGKFRTFLLTSLKRFLISEWEKGNAEKRGARVALVSRDAGGNQSVQAEPVEGATPEKIFDQRWAATLLEQVLTQLAEEFIAAGNGNQFDQLKHLLWGEKRAASYGELASAMGTTEGALKVAVHRLRRRYRELLRAEVARTVVDPGDVDEELRYLVSVISG